MFGCFGDLFVCLPILSDLMEFRKKLFLGKAEDDQWGMSQPEGYIKPLISCSVQKPRRGSCLPGNTQHIGDRAGSRVRPETLDQRALAGSGLDS